MGNQILYHTPFLDLSVKKAKINDYYFNNLYLVTSPVKEGMIIERFDFKNSDLSYGE